MGTSVQQRVRAKLEFAAGIAALAEARVLARIRDYLARGRPLAGVPAQSLRAQWIDAYLAVRALADDEREDELRDLGSEFDLRGLMPPIDLVAANATQFRERLEREARKRKPDWTVIEQIEAEVEELCDRLIVEERTAT